MVDKQDSEASGARGASVRVVEIIVAATILGLGALVMVDSHRVGASWAPDGPQSGYFPFYIGLILCAASAWILLRSAFARRTPRKVFVSGARLKRVLAVLLPSVVFVAVIYLIGIYVASALYIAIFMRWQGRFALSRILPVSLGVPVVVFLLFEVWFLVPLPKGPIEALLGY